jgi:hypothetical protein
MSAKSNSIHNASIKDDHPEPAEQSAKHDCDRIAKPTRNPPIWPHDWQNDDYWSVEQVARYTTLDRSTIYPLRSKRGCSPRLID